MGDAEAESSGFACQKQGDKGHSDKSRGRMARGKRFPTINDCVDVSVLYKQRFVGELSAYVPSAYVLRGVPLTPG